MVELTQQERLQPSLLDRLTDEEPGKKQEPREKRVLSLKKLREGVRRDLAWLFNAGNLASAQDLEPYPEVARSVLNYGMPNLAGSTVSNVDVAALERILRQAITDFEPRIVRNSIKVRLVVDEAKMSHNAVTFEIEGLLWAQPTPLQIYLKTEFDLEMGDVKVTDHSGASAG
jgi:type VI secretion system protein ImpF